MEEKENEETTSSNNGEMEKKREEEGEEEAWGTLEELLLVCAVNRHGFNSWDSIAKELQKRIKHSSNNDDKIDVVNDGDDGGDGDGGRGGGTVDSSFSSGNCRKKYVHLKRRFHHEEEAPAAEEEAAVTAAEGGEEHLMRMVDELRKLRVEELKREVHRHDVSIVSLQLKVKKLEEERENNKVKAEDEEENEEEKTVLLSDLRIKPEENATATGEKGDERERSSLERVVTGDSAENRSCNESNSTNHPKTDNTKPGNESKRGEPGAVRVERKRSEPVGGDNHNHNNNRKVSRLSELGESLSESRRESTRQQSSDVQSSASLSKKKRRRFRGDSGDELEAEEVSPANKRINAKSQPLIRFLETLRSHKHGSVFQRRLPSQETEKYRNVIRQHMDLDTVQSRLDKGIYCDCHPKFYRDILLTFTNAVLFYRKSTAEHIAARELRRFVMDEIQKTRKPKVQPRKPNLEPQHLEPVVKKPRSSTTMVVCRRRISNSMQPLSDGMKKADTNHTTSTTNIYGKNNNSSNVVNGREEKVKPDQNQKKVSGSNNISSGSLSSKKEKEKEGDENLKKLLTKERSNLGNGGLRLSNSNGKKIISKEGGIKREKTGNVSKDSKQESSEGERVEVMERKKVSNSDQKQEKGTPPTPVLKKQGVAKFLKRMKQNSPSSQEKVKSNDSEEDEEEEEGVREKNPSNNKNNARKTGGNLKKSIVKEADVVGTTRRSSSRRGEEAAASRRGIGRPPKRKAAMMSGNTPDSGKGGRSGGRDGSEKFKKKPRR